MTRVLIVDDEPPARDGLRLRLEPYPDFTVVGEASSGRVAITETIRRRPDLLFLDIRMPDLNGFEVLQGIPAAIRPRVVFVTASQDHAVAAFDVHALDYLLKPIVTERFQRMVEHVRETRARELAADTLEQLSRAVRGDGEAAAVPPEAAEIWDRLAIRDGRRTRLVPVNGIQRFEACGNYVTVHVGGRTLLHRVTLSDLESHLPPRSFARVHRGAIVNVAEIVEIHHSRHGDSDLVLKDGTVVRMSRRYRGRLK